MILGETTDHRSLKDVIPVNKGTYITTHGIVRKKCTTRGWEKCARWKDRLTDWIALKDLKDSYPIQ